MITLTQVGMASDILLLFCITVVFLPSTIKLAQNKVRQKKDRGETSEASFIIRRECPLGIPLLFFGRAMRAPTACERELQSCFVSPSFSANLKDRSHPYCKDCTLKSCIHPKPSLLKSHNELSLLLYKRCR